MFYECSSLSSIPLFDTHNVYNMGSFLEFCTSLTSVPKFDTSNVLYMDHMLDTCVSLTSVPVFDTHNVIVMEGVCEACNNLTAIPQFDTTNVTNISRAFQNCINVQSGALNLYNQATAQAVPPTSHIGTFNRCGINTEQGSIELAQIPSGWKMANEQ